MKNASGLKLKGEEKKAPELKIGNEDGIGYRASDNKVMLRSVGQWC